jgi:hypothetical protein
MKLITLLKEYNVSYSAVVLDRVSHNKLLRSIEIPNDWVIYAHHMTINLGNLKYKQLKSKIVKLIATEIASNNKVIAVKVVTDVPSKNQIKHITIAVNKSNGGKPVMSNMLTNWKPIQNIELTGKVEEL